MNLLFSINQKCIDLLLNCMKSISLHGGADSYDAYILHSDLGFKDKDYIKQHCPNNFICHFLVVDTDLFEGFPTTKRYPLQIYYRLAAAELLPKDLDRILYLDVDTIIINPLIKLYYSDFKGNIFMACTHTKKRLTRINQVRLNISKDVPYINTGVMMMNLAMMRDIVCLNDIREYVMQMQDVLVLFDQDILTALYGHKVLLIDPLKYNISDRDIKLHNAKISNKKIDIEWVRDNSVIIHYYGRNKPWKKHYIGILDVFYDELINTNS
ncbi:MAG: glycosyltransferase family 8 protein [Erysipelotrichales bacterium]|nr:glycosyltransferase family 8 protein [Erysipelotrichales bacterium]